MTNRQLRHARPLRKCYDEARIRHSQATKQQAGGAQVSLCRPSHKDVAAAVGQEPLGPRDRVVVSSCSGCGTGDNETCMEDVFRGRQVQQGMGRAC